LLLMTASAAAWAVLAHRTTIADTAPDESGGGSTTAMAHAPA
jgi:hypothetical protein